MILLAVLLALAATPRVRRRVRACRLPAHVALVREDHLLLVNCYGGSELLVVDAARGEVLRRVRVGRRPNDLAVTRDGRFAVTGDEATETVSFVDLESWSSVSLKVPAKKPCGVIVGRDDRRVYVTARGSDELLVIGREPIPPRGAR